MSESYTTPLLWFKNNEVHRVLVLRKQNKNIFAPLSSQKLEKEEIEIQIPSLRSPVDIYNPDYNWGSYRNWTLGYSS